MSDIAFGWLGQEQEYYAWEKLRETEDVALGEWNGSQETEPGILYSEFSEVSEKISDLSKFYKGRPFTWELERQLYNTGRLPYELIPTHTQDTGNCVAAGLAGAGMKLQVLEIALLGQEEEFREWFVPWIYAVSRNQIHNGMNGAGSTGAWGAAAVNKYGVLFSDDKWVPEYRGTSDEWGNRRQAGSLTNAVYGKYADMASDNPVVTTRLKSVDQVEKALDAGMQLTIASNAGFRVSEYKGLHVYRPSGSWSHQMHITDIRRDPELMFYRMNQWGPGHARPLNEETPGGAWNFASDLEREIKKRGVEIYGYNRFSGHPGDADFNII